jgi:cell wall-associated NlpC family hydrolase
MSAAQRFVDVALGEVGKSYASHRDCSGFVAWAARQVGINLPEGSVAQYGVGERVADYSDEPATLHFWDTYGRAPGHVAIGVGDGRVIHALNEQRGIIISELNAPMGGPYMGARRIFADEGESIPQPIPEPSPSPRPERDRDRQRTRLRDRQRRRRRRP